MKSRFQSALSERFPSLLTSVMLETVELILPSLLSGSVLQADVPDFISISECPPSYRLLPRRLSLITPNIQFLSNVWLLVVFKIDNEVPASDARMDRGVT